MQQDRTCIPHFLSHFLGSRDRYNSLCEVEFLSTPRSLLGTWVLLLLFHVSVFVPCPHWPCPPEVVLPSLLLGRFLFLEQLQQPGVPSCYLIL